MPDSPLPAAECSTGRRPVTGCWPSRGRRGRDRWCPLAAEEQWAAGDEDTSVPGARVRAAYDYSVDLVDLGRLTEEQYAELVGDEEDPWSAARLPLDWRPKDRHIAMCDDDGKLVAAAGLVVAEVQFGERQPIGLVGIGSVIVAARHRRRGLGWQVISAAVRSASDLGPDVAMLFCRPALVELYRRHGFAEVPGPVLVDQPSGVVEMPWVTMWRPLKRGASFADGVVKLHGLPF